MAKILIVEDNEMNMRLFSDLLKSRQHTVISCGQSLDAMNMILQNRPDIILMDIQMPEISGLELTRLIRQNGEIKDTTVIAVSAFAMADDIQRIKESGCTDYISKPIEIGLFFETIDKYLH